MEYGNFSYPIPTNEPVLAYGPGSPEKATLKAALKKARENRADLPSIIGGKEVRTGVKVEVHAPHERKLVLADFHKVDAAGVQSAIDAALKAAPAWAAMSWEMRAGIFLRAADLIATKYRPIINAATMHGQSKNAFQAEIDSACELIDFLRFNVHFLDQIYRQQPISGPYMHNRMEYRPLEGFVFAVTPFNFTAIAGNLPTSVAMCGNVVVWKAANTQALSAHVIMEVLKEAGLPDGVINLVYADGPVAGDTCLKSEHLAGIHFTGSTGTFNHLWKTVGENIGKYRSYPRLVGETGGKDFVLAHPSAIPDAVATGLLRGAFEYQGQKCSAASRAYLPKSLAKQILDRLVEETKGLKMGTVENFENFINAVIDEASFDRISGYLDRIKANSKQQILCGGTADKSEGYFVQPTVVLSDDPQAESMCQEIFGPVLSIHVYDDNKFEDTLKLVDQTGPYALTGAIFGQDRQAIQQATSALRQSAGNFYINDKPTGAVVGQQPFGGARKSGTNDKAGSSLNLYRWLSARTIKETFVPPVDYKYPFHSEA